MTEVTIGNVFRLLREILITIDKKEYLKGERMAYMMLNLLIEKKCNDIVEISKMVQVITLHNIKVSIQNNDYFDESELRYDIMNEAYMNTFLKGMNIYNNSITDIILFDRMSDKFIIENNIQYKEEINMLKLLSMIDNNVFNNRELEYDYLEKLVDSSLREDLLLFENINDKNNIWNKIKNEEHIDEIYDFLDRFKISKREQSEFAKMIMYFNMFRSIRTVNHSLSVEVLIKEVYKILDIKRENEEEIYLAALCHDIGKILTPIEILEKKGILTYDEMEIMKKHASHSYDILYKLGLEKVGILASSHHEKIDGSGYPYSLKEKEISFDTRMLAGIDILSALIEVRSYKCGFNKEQVIERLTVLKETDKLDPDIVDIIVNNYDILHKTVSDETKNNIKRYRKFYEESEQLSNKLASYM